MEGRYTCGMYPSWRARQSVVALVVLCLYRLPVHAQSAEAPPVTVKWNNGLDISTADVANEFQAGAVIQLDGRFGLDDPDHDVSDTFVMRRVRAIFQGRVSKYITFRLMPDFGNGQAIVPDAYVDVRFSRAFRIRFGKDKTPVGLEQLYSGPYLLFPERSLLSNLVPNRELGVQAQGDLGAVSYIVGVFNGVPDALSGALDTDTRKDLAARVTVRAFTRTAGALQGLGVAAGATHGHESGALPSYHTTKQSVFFAYAPATSADGSRARVSPSVFYYYKSFGGFAEYAHNTQAVRGAAAHVDLTHTAWDFTGSYVLTGEATSERGVMPQKPFDPAQHHWGAVQIAVRYSRLDLDPSAFSAGLATSTSSQAARAMGIAATLYAGAFTKYVLSFERTVFDDGLQSHRAPENALVFRLQLSLQPSL